MNEDAQAMMRREMRVTLGNAPTELDGEVLAPEDLYAITSDSFLLWTYCGLKIFYRKGEGVTLDRSSARTTENERLYLNGTTYAGVASINGLYPIHASAVSIDGRVHAFTGPSGAGKSTLTAGLGMHGLKLFCDDMLVLDLRDDRQIMCLPGHKQLKLLPDAIELAGAAAVGKVAEGMDKYYAEPAGGLETAMLPLAELCFLEVGEPARFEDVAPAERMVLLDDDHYTAVMYRYATGSSHHERFRQLARLANRVKISRFFRSKDAAKFHAETALAAGHVRSFENGGSR